MSRPGCHRYPWGVSMTDRGDPKVTYRMPRERLERIDDLAEKHGVGRSEMLRRFDVYALEAQGEALEDVDELDRLLAERDRIAEEGRDVEKILGFPGRVQNHLEDRFKEEWSPDQLLDSARSYYREAETLEDAAEVHPDVESVGPGDFVEAVDRALEDAAEAMQLSDWEDRYTNPYEKYDGVEEGKKAERLTLAITRTMMQKDEELEPLRSLSDANPRVGPEHFAPGSDEEDLPEGVTLEGVAEAARRLVDSDVDPDALPLDPLEFRRNAPPEVAQLLGGADVDEDVPEVEAGAVTVETETDGGAVQAMASDGGDHLAVQAFDEEADDDRVDEAQEAEEVDDGRDVEALVEETAEKLRDAESYSSDAHTESYVEKEREKRRRTAEEQIRAAFESDTDNWRDELMADTDLTPTDLIDLADDYNDAIDAALRGEREDVPDVVVDENGGVALE